LPLRWDPLQYARYATERSRPFFDLVAQIAAVAPRSVIDLGCGSGELTLSLADRWPEARIRGIDSSREMIDLGKGNGTVSFELADAAGFDATGVDVLISNALLQWLPDHMPLLDRWARQLNPGGWLAFQVPANFDAPSHVLMRELAGSSRWRTQLRGVLRQDPVSEPAEYVDLLASAGFDVNAWQTVYLHILHGDDPVLEWVRATGLRPVLEALSEDDAAEFMREYAGILRDGYPTHRYGTVFPFRRTFVVAHKSQALKQRRHATDTVAWGARCCTRSRSS
jgi:trans-aconitate 2-methyltransferase